MSTTKKSAIVTGAGRGIGQAIACALADAGFDLCLNDLSAVSETAEEAGRRGARVVQALGDIAEPATHALIVRTASEAFGKIDCLVNNAGIQVSRREDILLVTPESFDRLITVNLRGTFFLTQAVAARMLEQSQEQAGRCIVTLSSANAAMASVEKAEYCIAKTGLSMMNKLFALRLAEHGVCCHEIQPGLIETDMTAPVRDYYGDRIRQGLTPIRRWGQPEEIARAVVALATEALPFSTGQAFHIDGGLQLPRL